jgi:hypothetical protein
MRKRKPKLRVIAPDPRYGDPMVTQFVNNLMWQGKKTRISPFSTMRWISSKKVYGEARRARSLEKGAK